MQIDTLDSAAAHRQFGNHTLGKLKDAVHLEFRPLFQVAVFDTGTNLDVLDVSNETDESAYCWFNSIYSARQPRGGYSTWFKLQTESRMALLNSIDAIVDALDGLPVTIEFSQSWRWDHKNLMPNGRPSYHAVYVLSVNLTPWPGSKSQYFECKSEYALELRTLMGVSRADSPLVGTNLFDYQRYRELDLFNAYNWTATALIVFVDTADKASNVGPLLFPEATVTIAPKKIDGSWMVSLVFPLNLKGIPNYVKS